MTTIHFASSTTHAKCNDRLCLAVDSRVSRVRVAIVLCWFAAAVYNLPRFFERSTTITQSSTAANSSSMSSSVAAALVNRTALRENTVYIIVYKTALFFVARFLLPFCALAYFNTRLLQHSPDLGRDRTSLRSTLVPPAGMGSYLIDLPCRCTGGTKARVGHSPDLGRDRTALRSTRNGSFRGGDVLPCSQSLGVVLILVERAVQTPCAEEDYHSPARRCGQLP